MNLKLYLGHTSFQTWCYNLNVFYKIVPRRNGNQWYSVTEKTYRKGRQHLRSEGIPKATEAKLTPVQKAIHHTLRKNIEQSFTMRFLLRRTAYCIQSPANFGIIIVSVKFWLNVNSTNAFFYGLKNKFSVSSTWLSRYCLSISFKLESELSFTNECVKLQPLQWGVRHHQSEYNCNPTSFSFVLIWYMETVKLYIFMEYTWCFKHL